MEGRSWSAGLIRSLGGWSQVLAARRRGEKPASDQRILGSGDFIEQAWTEADKKAKETLRVKAGTISLEELLGKVSGEESIAAEGIQRDDRRREVVKARRRFCEIAVKEFDYSGAAVARFLGLATATVNRYIGLAMSSENPPRK